MSATFDTIGYVRKLEAAGIDRGQAEAHADAAREFFLVEVATRHDIERLEAKIDALEQRMTIKLGSFLVVAVGAIVALERMMQ